MEKRKKKGCTAPVRGFLEKKDRLRLVEKKKSATAGGRGSTSAHGVTPEAEGKKGGYHRKHLPFSIIAGKRKKQGHLGLPTKSKKLEKRGLPKKARLSTHWQRK